MPDRVVLIGATEEGVVVEPVYLRLGSPRGVALETDGATSWFDKLVVAHLIQVGEVWCFCIHNANRSQSGDTLKILICRISFINHRVTTRR